MKESYVMEKTFEELHNVTNNICPICGKKLDICLTNIVTYVGKAFCVDCFYSIKKEEVEKMGNDFYVLTDNEIDILNSLLLKARVEAKEDSNVSNNEIMKYNTIIEKLKHKKG